MATRYWVGGSGTWDATSTTNWATSSGGSSGASAPTSADNVIFDAASDAGVGYTATLGVGAVCNDLTMSGLDVATVLGITVTSALSIHGSMTLPATNLTVTSGNLSGNSITFRATTTGKTITTNGVSMQGTNVILDGVGGGWTLGSAWTQAAVSSSLFTVTNGTFSTSVSNYSMTLQAFASDNSNTRTISFNASTITLAGSSATLPVWDTETITNLTFNEGTSQITCSGNAPTFFGGGETYYNVSFTSVANSTTTITGANTFNNLTQASRTATGRRFLNLVANQTVSGTLTLGAANTSVRRMVVLSDTVGTQRTITCNGTLATLTDVDFRDINAAGTVGTWTGTRIGNLLGNSNITFTTAADKYWNLAAGGSWSATAWATSSGGAVAANNFPLAQDKVIIENTGLNTSATITIDSNWMIGELDISTRTNAMTLANGTQTPNLHKNITLSSAVTMTGTGEWLMRSRGTTQILDVNTVTFTPPIEIDVPTGTFQLAENTTFSSTVTLTQGTLNLNNNTLTCNAFASSNSNTRVIAFGTGNITVTGNDASVWQLNTITNFSYTGTPTVNFTYSGSTGTRTITNGNAATQTESTAININITAGTDTINFGTVNGIKNLSFTGFAGTLNSNNITIYGNLTVSSGMTLTASTNATAFGATSGTQEITSNGKTFDFPITQDGIGGTVKLIDNLTMGSTRTYFLNNGTLNLNNFNLSTGLFSSSNSNTRVLTLGTGTMTITGSGSTAFNITDGTNLTVNRGTSIINMASASAKTFAGGGKTYYRLNQGGAGILTITGANTFHDIINTTQPATITFPASTTTTVSNFSARGTSGNLISLRSSTPGTQFTLTYVP
jgi:hypothetical protein